MDSFLYWTQFLFFNLLCKLFSFKYIWSKISNPQILGYFSFLWLIKCLWLSCHLYNGLQQMFESNWRSKNNTKAQTHTQTKPSCFTWEHSATSRCPNHRTCMNFDLAFTKLQPIVSWHAVDIKTNGPISVKCVMTDRCVGFGGFVWSDTCGGPW